MRKTVWMLLGSISLTMGPVMAADGEDLTTGPDQPQWARWQGRLSLGTNAPLWRLGVESPAPKLNSASLMGDYYFGRSLTGAGRLGGFRATSGLIFGPRGVLSTGQPGLAGLASGNAFNIGSRLLGQAPMPHGNDAASENATLPYLGFGYTGLSVRSGWTFSADLGLIAQNSGNAARLGRVFSGGQSLDDAVRDLRMAPLLQFGVSYSF